MISIQTAMLVALGFLIASLIAVLLTPAYRARTVRLTAARVRAQLPITERELNADKDRIRADNALRVHRLETQLERFKFGAARQLVEVNRRDGQINTLNGDLEAIRSELEVAQNARNVLEQTIADRLPKVEMRLIEAKKLLFQRDREIASLTDDAARTQRALVEAVQINAQQRGEIERMAMVLETRGAQNRDGLADPTFDAEVALRAELEALRTRTRDQASLIERLKIGGTGNSTVATDSSSGMSPLEAGAAVPEVVRLQRELMRAETALKSMKDVASADQAEASKIEIELRSRSQLIEDQAEQLAGLAAALRTYQDDTANDRQGSIKDSKIALKSRLSSLSAQAEIQNETIRKLRAEVASYNERLARQAQHFMEEMRRLGAGTLPASAQVRRTPVAAVRRSLTQRIGEARPDLAKGATGIPRQPAPVLVSGQTGKPGAEAPAAAASATVMTPPARPALARPARAKLAVAKPAVVQPEAGAMPYAQSDAMHLPAAPVASGPATPPSPPIVEAKVAGSPQTEGDGSSGASVETGPPVDIAVAGEASPPAIQPPMADHAAVKPEVGSAANGHGAAGKPIKSASETTPEAAVAEAPARPAAAPRARLLDRINDYSKR